MPSGREAPQRELQTTHHRRFVGSSFLCIWCKGARYASAAPATRTAAGHRAAAANAGRSDQPLGPRADRQSAAVDASSRLRKLKLPVRVAHALAVIGVVSFFLFVALGFSYMKMAFKASDYDKLQTENTTLKIQKKNLEVAAVKLGEKLSNIENLFADIQNLVENDSLTKRGKLNAPGVGGSRVDYTTSELLGSANLKDGIDILKDRTTEMESQLTLLQELAQKKASIRRITPTIWPVKGHVTSPFGSRKPSITSPAGSGSAAIVRTPSAIAAILASSSRSFSRNAEL